MSRKKHRPPSGSEWKTYRRLLGYTRPYRWRMVVAVVFGAVLGGSTLGVLTSAQSGMVRVFGGQATRITQAMQESLQLWYAGGAKEDWLITLAILLLLPLFGLLRGLGFFLSKYFIEWVGQRVIMDLRNQVFGHILYLPMLYFSRSRTGELMSRTMNDTALVERGVSTVICDLVQQPFVLAAAVTALLLQDIRLAGLSLVLFPICIIPVTLFGRRVRRNARIGQGKLADLASIQQEVISGARVVKAFCMEEGELAKFKTHCLDFFRRQVKIVVAQSAITPLIEFISLLAACLVLLYARRSGLTWDRLVVFLGALIIMYDPVKKLSRLHLGIQQSAAAADRIFEVLDTPATVQDRPGARPLTAAVGEIAYESVAFSYDHNPVLRDISLTARAGECIALVGSSGSGKTTLVSLLPRFFDVTAGRITINGVDVRDLTLGSLRAQIGLVSQEIMLFNDTVFNNIAYGCPSATRARVEEAAFRSHAHEFIAAMPQGYDAIIGERGVMLSGGQRQRLAIARALLRNPPILILDEATSALDTESERQVQAALEELMAHRTVFAIAHRLSTIQHADRILVLDKGRVIEQGSHQDLLSRGGQYKYLYDLQFRI